MAPAKSSKSSPSKAGGKAKVSKAKVSKKKTLSLVLSSSPEIISELNVSLEKLQHYEPPIELGKKCQAPVSSDSDIAIIETPLKHKKAKKNRKPSPGSPESGKLPIGKLARRLSFGSAGIAKEISASDVDQLASPRPIDTNDKRKRKCKPSAKVQYMCHASGDEDTASANDDRTPPPVNAASAELLQRTDTDVKSGSPDPCTPAQVETEDNKPEPADADESDSGSKDKLEPCQFKPFVSLIKEAHQRGEITDKESTMPLYERVEELLEGIGAKNFRCAFNFESDGLFANPARAAVDGIGIKDSRVAIAGGRTSMIFVSNDCVAICNLIIPGTNSSSMNMHRVKKIGIWPLMEEFDALTSYFGAVYEVNRFYCSFFGDVLTFQTQIEMNNTSHSGTSSSSNTPQKTIPFFGARAASTSTSHSFPAYLKFEEKVPIYDIRKVKFNFDAQSLGSLSSLPLYRKGISDIPANSAVTIGYTANTYPYNQVDAPFKSLALSLNVQFILLHGYIVPPSAD